MAFSLGLWVWAPSQSLKNGQKKRDPVIVKNTAFRWVFSLNPMVGTNTTISDFDRREKGRISASWQWMALRSGLALGHRSYQTICHNKSCVSTMDVYSVMYVYIQWNLPHVCVCAPIWLYMYIYIHYIYMLHIYIYVTYIYMSYSICRTNGE